MWVDVAGSEEDKGGGALGYNLVPEVERRIGIRAAYAGYAMLFPCAGGLFCGIIAVIVRWDKL